MSFWDNVKKFAQPYSDDEYDEYDDMEAYEEETPRRAARTEAEPAGKFEAPAAAPAAPKTGFSGQVLNINSGKQEVVLFRPSSFNDCTKAADDLRDKKAIIVNMENVDKALSRRVVDFLSGCAYALDGKVNKIAQSTYLFCPHSMDVVGDLENIQAEVESYV
ncbi:MAG: cell division protein SepF [Ruminococcaceae bacterium]|nr:cell division protein SepF [Oscillospiraceae bacterium]MBQ3216101.1 cell division protein SepF [Oscillospiraceae bacterium]